MKDIICVDLSILDIEELKDFCTTYNFSYPALLKFKQDTYAKLWIIKDGTCMCFTLLEENKFDIKDFDTIRFLKGYLAELSSMSPYQVPNPSVLLEVDAILDKIIKYGKDSLTLEEKEFLDNQ